MRSGRGIPEIHALLRTVPSTGSISQMVPSTELPTSRVLRTGFITTPTGRLRPDPRGTSTFTDLYNQYVSSTGVTVLVNQIVSTDAVRGVAGTEENLNYWAFAATGTKTMIDYAEQIASVRVNLSDSIYNGVASHTAVNSDITCASACITRAQNTTTPTDPTTVSFCRGAYTAAAMTSTNARL